MAFNNISLQQFGRLMPSFPIGMRNHTLYWTCLCDCGNTKRVSVYHLLGGLTKSCGCLHRDVVVARNQSTLMREKNSVRLTGHCGPDTPGFKHGHTSSFGKRKSPEYQSWQAMIQRCKNPNNTEWNHYGAIGIKVCDRWLNSFEAFLEDMGERPENSSLGRFGDVGNYEPGNCAWQTDREQKTEQKSKRQLAFLAA